MASIKDILEGWGRLLFQDFNSLAPELQDRANHRLLICNSCEIRNGAFCDSSKVGKHQVTGKLAKGCGCHLRAKSLSTNSKCPLGKW